MNLYIREFKRNLKGLLIWALVLISLVVLMMSMYPSIAKDSDKINDLLSAYPKELLSAFHMDELDFGDVFGFYSVEGYLFVTLFGSIYAILLSSGILSKEVGDKTIEFLLSKPITRREIITSKLLTFITNIAILDIFLGLGLLFSVLIFNDNEFSYKILFLLSFAPFVLHFTFGTIGLFISIFMKKSRQILSVSLGLVLTMYFFSIIANISDKLEFLKYFTPFEYISAADILKNESLSGLYMSILVIVNILAISFTYVIYEKKDITV